MRCAGAQTETEVQALRLFAGTFGYCLLGVSRVRPVLRALDLKPFFLTRAAACRRDCLFAALHRCRERARQASRALLVRVGPSSLPQRKWRGFFPANSPPTFTVYS